MDETSEIQTVQAFSLFFTWFSLAIMLTAAWITFKNKYIQVCIISILFRIKVICI